MASSSSVQGPVYVPRVEGLLIQAARDNIIDAQLAVLPQENPDEDSLDEEAV